MRKMLKGILIFMAVLLISTPCYAQWAMTYDGGTAYDFAYDVRPTDDGGYIVAGESDRGLPNYNDAWILKLNSDGTINWEKSYNNIPGGNDRAWSIEQTADGGYVVTGNNWVMKLNSDGTVDWQKFYPASYAVDFYSIKQTFDQYGNPDGYIVAGLYYTTIVNHSLFVMKINSDGTIVWQKIYGGDYQRGARSIQQTFDQYGNPDGYIVTGYRRPYNGTSMPPYDLLILKLNSDGTIAWQKIYGGVGDTWEIALSIQQTTDGGYIVGGTTLTSGVGQYILILELDSSGNNVWQSTYSITGNVTTWVDIQQTADGGYIVSGNTIIFKLDTNGTVVWGTAFNGVARSIRQAVDGGYVVGGYSTYFSTGYNNNDFIVLKFNADGDIPGCSAVSPVEILTAETSVPGVDISSSIQNTGIVPSIRDVFDQDTSADILTVCMTMNNPPVVDAGEDAITDEGSTFNGSGSFSDPDADTWTATVDYGDGSGVQPLSLNPDKSFDLSHVYGDNGDFTVIVTVTDSVGDSGTDTLIVTVNNVAPSVGPISAPIDPVALGLTITASASFTDPGFLDTHTATWDWGDGTITDGTVTETDGSGTVEDNYTYSGPGVYTIILTVTDDDGGVGTSIYEYVVIYDPEGGFVTGGGWIDSPEGAYVPDPSLIGKANFGFVSKYKKGASIPTGQTEFHFQVADLNFHSDSYEWLVVSGSKVQYKGIGTINGEGEYKFMLIAIDADIKENDSHYIDRFRIKIWTEEVAGVEEVVYDNGLGADINDDNATTEIGGGSIIIHKK